MNGVSLSVDRGKTLGVVGESGCGKSVTALSIMRLIPPRMGQIERGSIRYDGRELLTLSNAEMHQVRGADISMVFQEPMTAPNPVLTVGQQIIETILLHKPVSRNEGAFQHGGIIGHDGARSQGQQAQKQQQEAA